MDERYKGRGPRLVAVDTNILVYAHRPDSEWHPAAFKLVAELANATTPWAVPWPCISEFFSTVTNPRIYKPHSTCEEAVFQIESWLESPSLRLIGESAGCWDEYREIILAGKIHGRVVHDAPYCRDLCDVRSSRIVVGGSNL